MKPWLKAVVLVLIVCISALGLLAAHSFREDVFSAEVAVVLGNEVYRDGTCAPRTAARLDRAVRLYNEGQCRIIIVSGGEGKSGTDEASAMHAYLLGRGIPAEVVVTDSTGADTRKTARFTAEYMARNNLSSVIAVSQYFHLPRTRLALKQAGCPLVGTAAADFNEWRDVYSVMREGVAYMAYYFQLK